MTGTLFIVLPQSLVCANPMILKHASSLVDLRSKLKMAAIRFETFIYSLQLLVIKIHKIISKKVVFLSYFREQSTTESDSSRYM